MMRPLRLSDLFALLFDPRVPVLFILGSLVLAVLGNGVYDLLVSILGSTPTTLAAIVVGSVFIFVFITVGGWLWIRRSPVPPVKIVQADQEADAHAGLIIMLSADSMDQGIEQHAVKTQLQGNMLKHCWMVASPEAQSKARELTAWLNEKRVATYTLPVANSYQALLGYQAVEAALQQATQTTDALPVIVDITGGPRPLAAGAVLACRDYGVPMEYVLGKYDAGELDRRARPQVVKVDLV